MPAGPSGPGRLQTCQPFAEKWGGGGDYGRSRKIRISSLLKYKHYGLTGLYLVQIIQKQGSPTWGGLKQHGWAEQEVFREGGQVALCLWGDTEKFHNPIP